MMNRIIMHHSAGPGRVTEEDKKHYHRIVDAQGEVHSGNHTIADNAPGKYLQTGKYAAHTRGLNTGSIGVAMAAMAGAQWKDPRGSTTSFPTEVQVKEFVREIARLAFRYDIPVTPRTILSHAEVQITLGVKQAGKWDFDYDPFGQTTSRDPVEIGDKLRSLIVSEIKALKGKPPASPQDTTLERPLLKRGSVGEHVKFLQKRLNIKDDGMFGPATEATVIAFQKSHELLPDGRVGKMTWAALTAKG